MSFQWENCILKHIQCTYLGLTKYNKFHHKPIGVATWEVQNSLHKCLSWCVFHVCVCDHGTAHTNLVTYLPGMYLVTIILNLSTKNVPKVAPKSWVAIYFQGAQVFSKTCSRLI